MSYLQIFKDKGGSIGASVDSRLTKYTVSIPSEHSMWAIQVLTKMLQNRKFKDSELAKAKKSIMIEIGEPSPIEKMLQVNLMEEYYRLFTIAPSFFKNEFGIDFF